MLHEGRIPGADAEHAAVDKLLAKHPGKSASLTREGPLMQVQIDDDIWHIDADGKTRKIRKKAS